MVQIQIPSKFNKLASSSYCFFLHPRVRTSIRNQEGLLELLTCNSGYGEVYGLVHLLKLEINKAFDSVGIGLFQQIDTFTSHYTRALEDLLQKLICSQR
ncbi:hypothetical protein QL285_069971 [Trifolium repens]|nr:hypothetical protein QL285_069971 [Trifolium repens]